MKMTIKQAMTEVRQLGLVLRRDAALNEFRVSMPAAPGRDTEPSAYYTDDLADAVITARYMATQMMEAL
jgi:hypothetical protein